ncbi:hypothetical protein BUALT_Bualt18G0009200 [Buddleja alternifolia]|uniref:protein disulfide-isomerase n=1 Tax=Buddleja alternifolia TaxID=168488 RepID=A0AAV6W3X0_9LAMI|nr:hypothetical protein BUALT_Bualt18G0009200 [Buddleja alternifolia]
MSVLYVSPDEAVLKQAEELDYKIKNNEEVGPLAGNFVGVSGMHEISAFLEVANVRGIELGLELDSSGFEVHTDVDFHFFGGVAVASTSMVAEVELSKAPTEIDFLHCRRKMLGKLKGLGIILHNLIFKAFIFIIVAKIWLLYQDGGKHMHMFSVRKREIKSNQRMEKSPLIVLLLLSLFAKLGVYALYGPSSPVLQLNPNNFKSKVLNSNGVVLVEFFAPWCGHCQALTPTWEKAANVLKGVATVAALDADAHQSLAQEYVIRGFPTIKVFAPGKPPVDYQGARDVKPIAEFALQQVKALLKERLDGKSAGGSNQKKSEPSASVELNSRNFDELVLKSKDLWIVEFFAPWCGHCKKLAPEWKKAANSLKGQVKLGHVDCDADKSLMSRFNVQGFPTILVFGADKDSPFPYEGARSASAIESFALEHLETNAGPPEVTELTRPDVVEEKCGSAAICFVAFLPDILDSKADGRNKYLELLLSVAENYLWAAAGKQPDLEKHVGVGGYGYPALVALNLKKKAYAPLKSAFERDQIIEFVKEAGRGGKGNLPLENSPVIVKTEPWDGKDGQIIEEDEFSLEELMGDDNASKDEV